MGQTTEQQTERSGEQGYTYLQATDGDGRMVMPAVPTALVHLVCVHQGQVPRDRGTMGAADAVWRQHQNETAGPGGRPRATSIRSMVVGDVLVLHDGPSETGLDSHSLVLVADMVGWIQASPELANVAQRLAQRGVPAHGVAQGHDYYGSWSQEEERAS